MSVSIADARFTQLTKQLSWYAIGQMVYKHNHCFLHQSVQPLSLNILGECKERVAILCRGQITSRRMQLQRHLAVSDLPQRRG